MSDGLVSRTCEVIEGFGGCPELVGQRSNFERVNFPTQIEDACVGQDECPGAILVRMKLAGIPLFPSVQCGNSLMLYLQSNLLRLVTRARGNKECMLGSKI